MNWLKYLAWGLLAGLPLYLWLKSPDRPPVAELSLATDIALAALASTGLNLIVGYTGQISLGHAAFFGIGAYATAILTTRSLVSPWGAIPFAVLVSALCGLILGLPALRLSGFYLAVVTLGFGQFLGKLAVQWTALTQGPQGITQVPKPVLALPFLPPVTLFVRSRREASGMLVGYALALLCLGLVLFFIANLVRFRIGRAMLAVRESEAAAQALAINPAALKLLAFTFGAACAGLAGSLFVLKQGNISSELLSEGLARSIHYLAMVVLGGLGTVGGPVLGAVLLTLLPKYLSALGQYQLVASGAVLLLGVTLLPRGLAGVKLARSRQLLL